MGLWFPGGPGEEGRKEIGLPGWFFLGLWSHLLEPALLGRNQCSDGCLRRSLAFQLPFPKHAHVPKQCLPLTGQAIPTQRALTHVPAALGPSW